MSKDEKNRVLNKYKEPWILRINSLFGLSADLTNKENRELKRIIAQLTKLAENAAIERVWAIEELMGELNGTGE